MQIAKKKYIINIRIFLIILDILIISVKIFSQQNLDFENGFKAWNVNNGSNVLVDKNNAQNGKSCIKIINGEINQRIETNPFSVIDCHAFTKLSDTTIGGYSFLRFYNDAGKMLLEYTSKLKTAINYQSTGFYTLAPFDTKYLTVGIGKDSNLNGFIYADNFSVNVHVGEPSKMNLPKCNINEYMKPFWQLDTIYNETVLLYAEGDKPAMGNLLFQPLKILSVQAFNLRTKFTESNDYVIKDNKILRTPQSKMPFRADTSFDTKTDLAWFNLQSQWVVVTYIRKNKYDGPTIAYKADKLPSTLAKLTTKSPVKIIAYGISITRGMDVSSFDTVPPFMPTYVDLFCHQLKKIYGYNNIKMFNAGLPGSTVDWGAEYADKYINPVKPELVIIDFGMNDFWRYTPEQFKSYIQTIINKIKAANPKTEFILLSNMKFDPDYIIASDKYKTFYENNLSGYNLVLQQLEEQGIVNVDMTTLSNYIYQHKKAKDCLVNPLHPNDYLARWFAQSLVALFKQ